MSDRQPPSESEVTQSLHERLERDEDLRDRQPDTDESARPIEDLAREAGLPSDIADESLPDDATDEASGDGQDG